MADRIKISPTELRAQAEKIRALNSQLDMAEKRSLSAVSIINNALSAKFSPSMRQKSSSLFSMLSSLKSSLDMGATVADNCAAEFSSVDSELAKLYSTDQLLSFTKSAQNSDEVLKTQLKEEAAGAGEAIEWLETWYEENMHTYPKIWIDVFVPDSLKEAYSLTSDILQGELTFDSIGDIGKTFSLIAKNSMGYAVFDSISYALGKGSERNDEMMAEAEKQLREGDVLGTVMEISEGFVDIVLCGASECLFNLGGDTIDNVIGDIPVMGYAIELASKTFTQEVFGEPMSIGDCVKSLGEGVSDVVDKTTDVITGVTDVVTSGITTGVKGVCSFIGKLMK